MNMAHPNLNGGMLLKITVASALVSLYFAGMTRGFLSAVLATLGFVAITAFLIVVMLMLLTRD